MWRQYNWQDETCHKQHEGCDSFNNAQLTKEMEIMTINEVANDALKNVATKLGEDLGRALAERDDLKARVAQLEEALTIAKQYLVLHNAEEPLRNIAKIERSFPIIKSTGHPITEAELNYEWKTKTI